MRGKGNRISERGEEEENEWLEKCSGHWGDRKNRRKVKTNNIEMDEGKRRREQNNPEEETIFTTRETPQNVRHLQMGRWADRKTMKRDNG